MLAGNFCGWEQLFAVLATTRNFCAFLTIFEQNIGLVHTSSTKNLMISQKPASYAHFLSVYQPTIEKRVILIPCPRIYNCCPMNIWLSGIMLFKALIWHSSKQLSSILRAQSIGTVLSTGITNSPSLPFHPLSPHPPHPPTPPPPPTHTHTPIVGNSVLILCRCVIASDGCGNFIVRYKHF